MVTTWVPRKWIEGQLIGEEYALSTTKGDLNLAPPTITMNFTLGTFVSATPCKQINYVLQTFMRIKQKKLSPTVYIQSLNIYFFNIVFCFHCITEKTVLNIPSLEDQAAQLIILLPVWSKSNTLSYSNPSPLKPQTI